MACRMPWTGSWWTRRRRTRRLRRLLTRGAFAGGPIGSASAPTKCSTSDRFDRGQRRDHPRPLAGNFRPARRLQGGGRRADSRARATAAGRWRVRTPALAALRARRRSGRDHMGARRQRRDLHRRHTTGPVHHRPAEGQLVAVRAATEGGRRSADRALSGGSRPQGDQEHGRVSDARRAGDRSLVR